MGCRMALRAFLILPQLPLRPLPGFWINDRRHWDSNPLARRPPGPALGIPWDPVVAPAAAIRLVCFLRLGPGVIGFALVEGVAQHLDNTTLCPAPLARLARNDPLCCEPPLDGVGTALLFHTPAIDEADHLGFGLVDDQVLRGRRGFADVGVAIGGIAPVDPPLARRKQAAP